MTRDYVQGAGNIGQLLNFPQIRGVQRIGTAQAVSRSTPQLRKNAAEGGWTATGIEGPLGFPMTFRWRDMSLPGITGRKELLQEPWQYAVRPGPAEALRKWSGTASLSHYC